MWNSYVPVHLMLGSYVNSYAPVYWMLGSYVKYVCAHELDVG